VSARGGKRPGAGRPKSAATRRTQEIVERANASGESPLEYMLRTMRDAEADQERRDEMARAAAPYMHPRLASIEGDLNLHLHKHEEALDELE
jgi:hypothetical protein